MTPLNPLESAYLFDHGRVKLKYISNDPYPYEGSDDIEGARAELRELARRITPCVVDWFRVPMEWVFHCPKHTYGFAYMWANGQLSVELSPKNTEASTGDCSEPLTFSAEPGVCAHPGVEAAEVHGATGD